MILWNLIGDDRTIIEAVQKLLSGQGGFNAQHIEKAEFKSTRFQYLQLFRQREGVEVQTIEGFPAHISQRGGQRYLMRRMIAKHHILKARASF